MYDKSSEKTVSALVEAQRIVQNLAEPRPVGDSVKAAIRRASIRIQPRLRWRFSRVRAIWYGDDRYEVSGDELNELRRIDAKRENDVFIAGLEAIAARLDRTDPDFHREDVAALWNIAGRLRQQDCE